ncbi:ABC transporter permease [Ferrimicrobium sp.]|uniref:ABC transporter permease n=1 Tax=Ferrimicrobium sp. TaxID=2926050 RepID=UPI002639E43F|nr:ABC transporter permease [Ferrimicrobium sp.]
MAIVPPASPMQTNREDVVAVVAPPLEVPKRLRFVTRALLTLWSNRKARAGLVILGFFILVAIFAPWLAPHSPTATSFRPYQNPNAVNWLGTTGNGQDVLSQMIYGTRVSLLVGLGAGLLATCLALIIGLVAGFRPGVVDDVLSFSTNLALVLPGLPLMIVIAAYLRSNSMWMILLVIGFTGWATGARVMRSQTATLRTRDFVTAATFSGQRLFRIVFREILPNMISLAAASFFGAATAAVIAAASLEFLGLGNPNTVSWGSILYWAENDNALLTGQWVLVFVPGLAIVLLALSFILINFGIDALSNPRLRER